MCLRTGTSRAVAAAVGPPSERAARVQRVGGGRAAGADARRQAELELELEPIGAAPAYSSGGDGGKKALEAEVVAGAAPVPYGEALRGRGRRGGGDERARQLGREARGSPN